MITRGRCWSVEVSDEEGEEGEGGGGGNEMIQDEMIWDDMGLWVC